MYAENATSSALMENIRNLFLSQPLAVLSTHAGGQPYCNLVAFVATDDLKRVCFATTRATRKFDNLERDARVSMLIDNRSNQEADFQEAMAVTLTGRASPLTGQARAEMLPLYLRKHPSLEAFATAPTCALVGVTPMRYFLVSRFQQVMVLKMEP